MAEIVFEKEKLQGKIIFDFETSNFFFSFNGYYRIKGTCIRCRVTREFTHVCRHHLSVNTLSEQR